MKSRTQTPDDSPNNTSKEYALQLDSEDPLSDFRTRFFIPDGETYLDGNSLGLQSKDSRDSALRVMDEWQSLVIGGWLDAKRPWFSFAEDMGAEAAKIMGATKQEVVATGTTTLNVHACVGSLYRPTKERSKIVAAADDFPTDIYALKSQIKYRGLEPDETLVLARAGEDEILDEDEIISKMRDDVAMVMLPSVFYRTGQLLDMKRLAGEARTRGIIIGFDCSHSAGAVPHKFDEWGIDFAIFCSYKYLNSGPGSPAFIYLNKKHFGIEPSLAGWFGYNKKKQFDLLPDFEPAQSAGCMQISSPGMLGAGAMEGALKITLEAGIERIREKSLKLTEYLMFLIDELLPKQEYGFRIVNPREPERRGGHVALAHVEEGKRICDALRKRGIVTDFRPPDIIRIAPVALYNTYTEVWNTVQALKEIVDNGEFESFQKQRGLIT